MHRLVLVPHYASVLAFLLPTVLHGQDDPTVSSGRREAASLFQNVAANWQHLDNYDVMIVETRQQTRDKPKSVSRVRMIADHGRNVYLFVGTGSYGN